MEDPEFPVTITVGGNGQSYKYAAFPQQMHSNQSFILEATLQKVDQSPYDLSSATANLYVSGWKNEIGETLLASGVIVSSTITFTVAKDLIPEALGSLPLRAPGNSVFYFIVEDSDSTLQFFQQVNVLDTNYTLDGSVDPSPNTIVPDKNDLGTVIEVNLNTPPGSPNFQDAYIVGTSPTGDWVGQENDLAIWNGSSWVFYDTEEGNFVYDQNTSQQYIFNGVIWAPAAAIVFSDGESILDNNGNELITFGVDAAAVNNVKVSNSATGQGVPVEAIGDDTNIDIEITPKGTGKSIVTNLQLSGEAVSNGNDFSFGDADSILKLLNLEFTTYSELTISADSVTATQLLHTIDTEGDAPTDDLDTITFGVSTQIFIKLENAARIVTLKDGTGNLDIGADIVMEGDKVYQLMYNGSAWEIVGGTGSGGGGGNDVFGEDNVYTHIDTEAILASEWDESGSGAGSCNSTNQYTDSGDGTVDITDSTSLAVGDKCFLENNGSGAVTWEFANSSDYFNNNTSLTSLVQSVGDARVMITFLGSNKFRIE